MEVNISLCCHINQGSFVSRKQLHLAAPTSPDGGSLPLPSCPLAPLPQLTVTLTLPRMQGTGLGKPGTHSVSLPCCPSLGWHHLLPSPYSIFPKFPGDWTDCQERSPQDTAVGPELLGQDALTRPWNSKAGGTPEHRAGKALAQSHTVVEPVLEPRALDA